MFPRWSGSKGRGGDLPTAKLFRCGVRRGGRSRIGSRQPEACVVEELADSEVEQLGAAARRHQHIGGIDVAVDDQATMRRLDGVADLEKQLEAFRQREPRVASPFPPLARSRRAAQRTPRRPPAG